LDWGGKVKLIIPSRGEKRGEEAKGRDHCGREETWEYRCATHQGGGGRNQQRPEEKKKRPALSTRRSRGKGRELRNAKDNTYKAMEKDGIRHNTGGR